jgi:hypothetical protein
LYNRGNPRKSVISSACAKKITAEMSETADKNTIAGAFGSGVFALRHIELLYYSDLFLSTVFSRFFSSFFFCVLFFPTSADLVFFREHCRFF